MALVPAEMPTLFLSNFGFGMSFIILSVGNDQESPQVTSDREMDGGDGAQGGR